MKHNTVKKNFLLQSWRFNALFLLCTAIVGEIAVKLKAGKNNGQNRRS